MSRLATLVLLSVFCAVTFAGAACGGQNTVHVIGTLDVLVVDNKTKEPEPNTTVYFIPSKVLGSDFRTIKQMEGQTNADGIATFTVECDLSKGEEKERLRLAASWLGPGKSESSVFISYEEAREAAEGGTAMLTRSVTLEK